MAGSLEANKLIAGVLTAGVVFVGASVLSDLLYHPDELAQPAYPVLVDEATQVAEAEPEPEVEPLPVRLAAASAADGEGGFRACAACHTPDQGGAHRVGPNLWDIMGAPIAAADGFNYSDALAGKEGEWTWARMDAWLENPGDWAPGTSMSYAGIKDPQDRADMIAYLRSLAAEPLPLPEPEAAPAEGAGTDEASGSEPAATGDDAATTDQAEPAADAPAEEAGARNDAAGDESEAAAASGAAGEGTAEETVAATTPAGAAPSAEGAGASDAAAATDLMVRRVASASVADGEGAFRACAACHTAAEGRPHRVGPNLWDVFGREIAGLDDFRYSDALAGKEGRWTVATLDTWLADPAGWADGTTMVYAGLKDPEERAAVIAYLHSLADDPAPLGAATDEASAAGEG